MTFSDYRGFGSTYENRNRPDQPRQIPYLAAHEVWHAMGYGHHPDDGLTGHCVRVETCDLRLEVAEYELQRWIREAYAELTRTGGCAGVDEGGPCRNFFGIRAATSGHGRSTDP